MFDGFSGHLIANIRRFSDAHGNRKITALISVLVILASKNQALSKP